MLSCCVGRLSLPRRPPVPLLNRLFQREPQLRGSWPVVPARRPEKALWVMGGAEGRIRQTEVVDRGTHYMGSEAWFWDQTD